MGVFASVATGAAARASGVKPKPARKSTLSRVTSSWTRRLAISGLGPVVSRTRSSIVRQGKVSPCSLKYALMPPSICRPKSAAPPEKGATSPTFTGSAAAAERARAATSAASVFRGVIIVGLLGTKATGEGSNYPHETVHLLHRRGVHAGGARAPGARRARVARAHQRRRDPGGGKSLPRGVRRVHGGHGLARGARKALKAVPPTGACRG